MRDYVGIDISRTIIEHDRVVRPDWKFICDSAQKKQNIPKARVVVCLSVLFHIMDDQAYEKILENLADYSEEWIIILTWFKNPFLSLRTRLLLSLDHVIHGRIRSGFRQLGNKQNDQRYQAYREFKRCLPMLEGRGFKLAAIERDEEIGRIGALFFLKKG